MNAPLSCIVCGDWPERDRWALREMMDKLPLQEIEDICDNCLLAWARNVGIPVRDQDAREVWQLAGSYAKTRKFVNSLID